MQDGFCLWFCCRNLLLWLREASKLHRNALTPVLRGRIKKINTTLDYVSGFKVILFKRSSSIHCPYFLSTCHNYELNAAFINCEGCNFTV